MHADQQAMLPDSLCLTSCFGHVIAHWFARARSPYPGRTPTLVEPMTRATFVFQRITAHYDLTVPFFTDFNVICS